MLTPRMSRDMSCRMSLLVITVFWGLFVPKADGQQQVPPHELLSPFLRVLGHNVTSAVKELQHNATSVLFENGYDGVALLEEILDVLTDIKTLQLCSLTETYSSCPSGWEKFQSSCYHISETSGTWPQGRAYCKSFGGDYVKISSQEESDFISGSTRRLVWLGLNDIFKEGTFTWISDSSIPVFTKWRTGEPNNVDKAEDCVHSFPPDYEWTDMPCGTTAHFACEVNLPHCGRLSN